MTALDLKKTLKHLYAPPVGKVSLVDVPPLQVLAIDGKGNPNTAPRYVQAVQALYALSYGIRAISKQNGLPFTVMPLEGLWWFEGDAVSDFTLTTGDKDRFIWTLMIVQPDHITPAMVADARQSAVRKHPDAPINEIRFEHIHEGEAVQIMHRGPYDTEGPDIALLHAHVTMHGWQLSGKHHEIYLSDPRKTAPLSMKTAIRQPFTR